MDFSFPRGEEKLDIIDESDPRRSVFCMKVGGGRPDEAISSVG